MDSWLAQLATISSALSSLSTLSSTTDESFEQLILPPPSVHAQLQNDLVRRRTPSVEDLAKTINTSSKGALDSTAVQRIAAVLHSSLGYIESCPPISTLVRTDGKSNAAWSTLHPLAVWTEAHSIWSIIFTKSSALFILPNSPLWFQRAFRSISSFFLTLSIRLDLLERNGKWPKLTECTGKLANPVRAAGTDRSTGPGKESKRGAVMWLGNDCLRGYFKLNNLKLCETVLKSIQEALSRNASPLDPEGESPYPMSQRVVYRYYLGRVRLSQGRVRLGFEQLQWALDHCHQDAATQIRRILLHLLPAALIVGYRPRATLRQLIQSRFPDLESVYMPLFEAYAKPDMGRWESLMLERERKEFLRKLGVYLLLQEKCPIGIWRGMVKRCLSVSLASSASMNSAAPPTLTMARLAKAVDFFRSRNRSAQVLMDDIREIDLECIVASLVDQGYIKGYTYHTKRLMVFQRGEKRGFADVGDVY